MTMIKYNAAMRYATPEDAIRKAHLITYKGVSYGLQKSHKGYEAVHLRTGQTITHLNQEAPYGKPITFKEAKLGLLVHLETYGWVHTKVLEVSSLQPTLNPEFDL
jgi:hypothetical protein